MRHAPIEEITGLSPVASIEGVFYGNTFTREDFQKFDGDKGSTYFSGSLNPIHQTFFDQIVQPGIEARHRIQQELRVDPTRPQEDYVWFDNVDDMRNIPEAMRLPLLLHPYVRKLAESGRIDDWGVDLSTYPKDNPFERMINNGVVSDVTACPKENGEYVMDVTEEWSSTDPKISEKGLQCIERMYALLDEEERNGSDISPTDRDSHIA